MEDLVYDLDDLEVAPNPSENSQATSPVKRKHRRKLRPWVKKTMAGVAAVLVACILFVGGAQGMKGYAEGAGEPVSLQLPRTQEFEELPLNPEVRYLKEDSNILQRNELLSGTLETLTKRTRVFVLEREEGLMKVLLPDGKEGWIKESKTDASLANIFDPANETWYSSGNIAVKSAPDDAAGDVASLVENDEVTVTGKNDQKYWQVTANGVTGYVDHTLLMTEKKVVQPVSTKPVTYNWNGQRLTPSAGVVIGPSGKETYYNLDMSGVVSIMRNAGFSEAEYPYWVRSDGCKMLGDYIMVAADLSVHPRGSTLETSLGTALVCDTGGFVSNGSGTKVDIAVNW